MGCSVYCPVEEVVGADPGNLDLMNALLWVKPNLG